ncbi:MULTISPECIES: hypothetical protein [unclassified Moorena]|nr:MULTISPECIES: hypothetical protein [unclassified Moorena]
MAIPFSQEISLAGRQGVTEFYFLISSLRSGAKAEKVPLAIAF